MLFSEVRRAKLFLLMQNLKITLLKKCYLYKTDLYTAFFSPYFRKGKLLFRKEIQVSAQIYLLETLSHQELIITFTNILIFPKSSNQFLFLQ